jgi:hypothetical protein
VRMRRRATADGVERRRTPANSPVCLNFELGGLDFECALHREVARKTVKPSRAAQAAKTWQRWRTVRRGGVERRRSSDELSSATRGAGTSTSGTGGLLTSLRDSRAAPRRRRGGDGGGLLRRRRQCFGEVRCKRRQRLGLG